MSKVYVFMADGTEEVEALTVVDLLLRAGITVQMVSIMKDKQIEGAHQIGIRTDLLFDEADYGDGDMIVLPGGGTGTRHLMEHEGLRQVLGQYKQNKKYLAAICAAPSVFGVQGLLEGRRAIAYPGFEDKLKGAVIVDDAVVHDQQFITSKGLGTAIDFSLTLIDLLEGNSVAERVATQIQYR